jgi:hypothetical protein
LTRDGRAERGLLEGCWRLTGAGRTTKGPIYSKPEKRRERGHKGKSSSLQLRWPGPSDLVLKRRPSSFAGFDHSTIRSGTFPVPIPRDWRLEPPGTPVSKAADPACRGLEGSRSAPAGALVAANGSWWHPVGALPFCAPSAPQCADAAVLPHCTDIADQPSLPVIRTGTVSRPPTPPLVQSLRFVWWSALPCRTVKY